MPAVGDLRSRLSAMAARDNWFSASLADFFERRMDVTMSKAELQSEIWQISSGTHPWLAGIGKARSDFVRASLAQVLRMLPASFDFRGACMGNLVLAGRYFANDRDLGVAVQDCSEILGVRGKIVPVSEQNAHLAVRFDSGRVIVGQHLFTGKKAIAADRADLADPSDWPIRELWLGKTLDDPTPVSVQLSSEAVKCLQQAQVLCYSLGSFYSSLLSALLPIGTAAAVRASRALKVFIPNPGYDPESCGLTLKEQLDMLVRTFKRQDPSIETRDVLDTVLVDTRHAQYPGGVPEEWFYRYCVARLDYPVFHSVEDFPQCLFPRVDDGKLAELLVSLATNANMA